MKNQEQKLSQDVGKNIRKLRKEKNLTLAEMAKLCQCSSSLLSQVETGSINPSFSIMVSISNALGVSMAELVTETAYPKRELPFSLMPADERKTLIERGVKFQLLTRSVELPFEFILNEWPPGCGTGKALYTHDGQECGFVLEGELNIEIGGKVYTLKPGDTMTLISSVPHRVWNPGKKTAVAIWVNSVPKVFSTK